MNFNEYREFEDLKANGINSNLILSERVNLSALYNKHGKQGFIIISANRSNMDKAFNEEKTNELENDIKKNHFRYLPVYGGYRGTDGVEDDYEPSFIVFPYYVSGSTNVNDNHWVDFKNLEQFAIDMCDKYNQDSVFVMRPNEAPIYLDRYGNKANKTETKNVIYNDPKQMFFTSLKNKTDVDKEIDSKLMHDYKIFKKKNPNSHISFDEYKKEHLTDIKSIGRRFTADIKFEMYFRPMFNTLNECIRRESMGEICIHKNDLV